MSKKISKTASRTQVPFKGRAYKPKIVQWIAKEQRIVDGMKQIICGRNHCRLSEIELRDEVDFATLAVTAQEMRDLISS
ncbi:MAG: hypothetical protein OSA87_04980 [Woeseiaceae bacterium]|nr:hypothetical protein [Woeseiaceae bacterium]